MNDLTVGKIEQLTKDIDMLANLTVEPIVFKPTEQSRQEAIQELIAAKTQLEQSLRSAKAIAEKHRTIWTMGDSIIPLHPSIESGLVINYLNAAIAAYTEQEQKGGVK